MLIIDLKSRFRNKAFLLSIISAVVLLIQQLGFTFISDKWLIPVNTFLGILTMLGIVVDTSTKGLSDPIIATVTENAIQAENTVKEVQVEASTTKINNVVSESSASSNIIVDNPDNLVSIGQEVNVISAVTPQ